MEPCCAGTRAVTCLGGGPVNLTLEELQREAAATGFLSETLEKALRLLALLDALRSHPFLRLSAPMV